MAFVAGALLPLVVMLLTPAAIRVPVTFIAVLVALALTGTTGAHLGGSSKVRASLRVVIGGAVALAFTYGVGRALGASGVV